MTQKIILVMLACCITGCINVQKKPAEIWNTYDVRRFNQTGPIMPNDPRFYSDNDAVYTAPKTSFGLCSDTDLAGFTCN